MVKVKRVAEKDYIAAVKKKADRPQTAKSYPKFLFYARNKKGKSTLSLSAGIEKTILIDPEKGTNLMKKLNPYRIHVEKWEDMQDAYGALRTGKLSPATLELGESEKPFEFVSVDGMTRIHNMALKYVMNVAEERDLDRKPGMVDRRDYNKAGELTKQLLTNFHNLKMGVIYTAHERTKAFDTGDTDEEEERVFFTPDLPDGVRGALNGIVDVIGRLYVVRVEIDGKIKPQRRLYIGDHDRYDTGYRSDYVLPPMIKNPTIPKLLKLMEEGKIEKKGTK